MNRKLLPHNKALNILRAENPTSFFAEVHYTLKMCGWSDLSERVVLLNETKIEQHHYLLKKNFLDPIMLSYNDVTTCANKNSIYI
jgi:hypothetical protein